MRDHMQVPSATRFDIAEYHPVGSIRGHRQRHRRARNAAGLVLHPPNFRPSIVTNIALFVLNSDHGGLQGQHPRRNTVGSVRFLGAENDFELGRIPGEGQTP